MDAGKASHSGSPASRRDLSEEIRIVRMLIRQAERKINNGDSLDRVLTSLRTIARASTNLAALLKAEKALGEEHDTSAEDVRAALAEIKADMEKKGIDSILTSGLD